MHRLIEAQLYTGALATARSVLASMISDSILPNSKFIMSLETCFRGV